jgi:hypothetical protein
LIYNLFGFVKKQIFKLTLVFGGTVFLFLWISFRTFAKFLFVVSSTSEANGYSYTKQKKEQ